MAMQHVEGNTQVKLTLYALSTCPWCGRTKKLLGELGVGYDFVDVDKLKGPELSETMKTVERWNPAGSFPVLVVDDDHCIIGFREDEIRAALVK